MYKFISNFMVFLLCIEIPLFWMPRKQVISQSTINGDEYLDLVKIFLRVKCKRYLFDNNNEGYERRSKNIIQNVLSYFQEHN